MARRNRQLCWTLVLSCLFACSADVAELAPGAAGQNNDAGQGNVAAADSGTLDTGFPDAARCIPLTCGAGNLCGPVEDGCGSIVDCGACAAPQSCGGGELANVCGGCAPCDVQVLVGPVETHRHNTAWGIVTDDTHVYWTNFGDGQVLRIPKHGGAQEILHSGQTQPRGIAIDDEHLYWTTYRGVWRMPKGGNTAELISGDPGPNTDGVALDETHVYWSQFDGLIRRRLKVGGEIETLATIDGGAELVLDATHVYWRTWSGGLVQRVSKRGGPVDTYATDQQGPGDVAVDETHVYWARFTDIQRMPKVGGNPEFLALNDSSSWSSLALSETELYWASSQGIRRMAKTGGEVINVADHPGAPKALVLDGPFLYWTSPTGTRLMQLPSCCGP